MVEHTINRREEHGTPIIVPSAEEEPALIARALEMVRPLNNTSIYKFEFISGTHEGTFIGTNNDNNYMFIQVQGSGRVSIPLCWLRSVEEKYIVIQM